MTDDPAPFGLEAPDILTPDLQEPDLQQPDLHLRSADYHRMEAALDWLARRWRERPGLEAAAAEAGLSPHHFQRVFTRWAGVSPKTFLAALAHAEACDRLAEGESVLGAALDTGLSGPSRLHDLFVAQEGVTPGQARRRGEGLTIRYGFAPSPFGRAFLAVTPRGLCGVGFHAPDADEAALADYRRRWPAAAWVRDDGEALQQAERVFGPPDRPPPPLHLIGPPFHVQVWKALLRIAPGRTATYGQVAAWAGRPGAFRATGAAIGANPVSFLIPCHRAIGADRRLTGYHWGLARKAAMLGLEASALHADAVTGLATSPP